MNAVGSSATYAVRRVERDLVELPSTDPINALPGALYQWLRDPDWVASALEIPSLERREWLAGAGAAAFAQDSGGYAALLGRLAPALADYWTADEFLEIGRRHTQWLLANLSDILDLRHGQATQNWDNVRIVGKEHLDEVLALGRGVMVLSAHQSHPGFGFFHSAWRELPISTVANLGDRSAPHTSLLLDGLRERVEVLPTTAAALRPMLLRLNTGGCVAIYGDYLYPGTPGSLSSLFGRLVLVASAAVSMALRSGVPVVPLGVTRQWPPTSEDVEVRVYPPLPLSDLDARDPQAHGIAALYFGLAIESLIRRNPEVWRLWATLPHRWRRGDEAAAKERSQTD